MGREVDYAQHDMRAPRDPQNMTVEDLWATQPHLRTVIDFRARNIAQLGVQLFEANGEQRARVRGTEVSKLLGRHLSATNTGKLLTVSLKKQRDRVRGTEVSKLVGRPNPYVAGHEPSYALV